MKNESCIDLTPVIERFQARVKHFGAHHYGVLWSNAEQQIRRFQLLAQVVTDSDLDGGLRIADFGCGYGAMYLWLKDESMMKNSSYIGYDITPEMIQVCKETILDKEAHFIHSDEILHAADYVFVSGTFTLKCDMEVDAWENFILSSLKQLWRKSKKGLAFNFLSDQQAVHDPELYYASAEKIREFCKVEMSESTRVVTDTSMQEFTVLVNR